MKNIFIVFLCLLIAFLICGCIVKKTIPSIEIYVISRDAFHIFLSNPSIEQINSNYSTKCYYSNGNEWHIRNGSNRFKITQSLIEFVRDKSKINNYLSQNDIRCEVNSAILVDTPNVPLTIWVKTDVGDFFITIDKKNEDECFYELYNLSDYIDKYDMLKASLNINGKKIENENSKIYSNYADIPFFATIKTLGASLTPISSEKLEIYFKEKNYVLDVKEVKLYEVGKESINLFYKDGGNSFLYYEDSELMIDSFTLNMVLVDMDIPITINCDRETKVVSIETRKTGDGSVS